MLIASYESSSTSHFVFIEQHLSTDWHLITFIGCGQGCHGGFEVRFRISSGTFSYVSCATNWHRLTSMIAKLLIINAMRMRRKTTERECDVFVVIAWWEDRVFRLLFSLFRFSDATTKIVYFPMDHCKEDFGLLIPLHCRTRQSIALYLSESLLFVEYVKL